MVKKTLGWATVAGLLLVAAACSAADEAAQSGAGAAQAKGGQTMVVIETSKGTIKVELDADKAPITVANFLAYTDDGFFDGTIFHRVIDGFMIQGGGFDADMSQKQTRETIKNEADNGLQNDRGTLAMARTAVVDSATAQFFINLKDNAFLDHTARDFGYAVFAQVTDGMDVVDSMAKVETAGKSFHENVPVEPLVIRTARRADSAGD